MPTENEAKSSLLLYFVQFFTEDWFASIPITICAVVTLAVIIDRTVYYSRNQRDISFLIRKIQADLSKGNLNQAIDFSKQIGGIIGLVMEEGLRLTKNHARNFNSAFDVSTGIYLRDLEKRISILSTIGATAPFIGLFGTVVGVILTLKLMGESSSGQSQTIVLGVAKALIATGYGLIVAIVAVVFNNLFNSIISNFESCFQLIKITLLDYIENIESNRNKAKLFEKQERVERGETS